MKKQIKTFEIMPRITAMLRIAAIAAALFAAGVTACSKGKPATAASADGGDNTTVTGASALEGSPDVTGGDPKSSGAVNSDGSTVLNEYLCAPNEDFYINFRTKDAISPKTVTVCFDKNEKYIVYRYGTQDNVELEFPQNKTDSWDKFTYSHSWTAHFRAYSIEFINGSYRYIVYHNLGLGEDRDEHEAEHFCGIYVINISTGKATEIPGVPESMKGGISAISPGIFRINENKKLKKIDYGNINIDGEDYSREYY